jgi:N-carbamoyl-L-amino-acid hydrolase
MEFARLGLTPAGGVKRLALTDLDNQARADLVTWGESLGFTAFLDPIGNLFIRREGTDPSLSPVLSGSHTDTQPSGGRFDGAYGVLAACEAVEAIHEAGVRTRRAIEVVVWTCEEGGARFPMGVMGSAAFVGAKPLSEILALTDDDGVTVAAALEGTRAKLPHVAARPLGIPVHAFVEAHIEQGPILEDLGKTIGVVTVIQGSRRWMIRVQGEDAHAGTTNRARRKDALQAATRMVQALDRHFLDPEDRVRFTVGRFRVKPDAMAVVPGYAEFSIDFRHPDLEALHRLGDQVAVICAAEAGPCAVEVEETSFVAPTPFTDHVPDLVDQAAARLGLPRMRMISGAGHDAMMLARVCPTGMIFVPCERGLSHNEAENATPADLAAGARVLAETLVALADQ